MIQRVQFSVDLVLDFHPVNHYCIPSWDCQLPRNLAKSRGFFHCFKCTLPTAKHPHWCCWLHFLLLDVSISSKEEISWNKQLQPLQLNRGVHPGMANPEILPQTNCKSVLNLFLHCPYRLSWVQTMQKDLAEKGFSECPFFLAAQCLFDAGCTKHLLPFLVSGQTLHLMILEVFSSLSNSIWSDSAKDTRWVGKLLALNANGAFTIIRARGSRTAAVLLSSVSRILEVLIPHLPRIIVMSAF